MITNEAGLLFIILFIIADACIFYNKKLKETLHSLMSSLWGVGKEIPAETLHLNLAVTGGV